MLLDWSSKLPPFQGVALRVMQLSEQENLDFRDLARLLSSDPAFSADLLRVANSPLFAVRSRVETVLQAATILGMTGIKSMAVTAGLRSFAGNALLQAHVRRCWTHSLVTAIVAQALARDWGVPVDRAYTAAILHDVGRLGLVKTYAIEYQPLLAPEYEKLEANLAQEEIVIGMTHCAAGAALMRVWSFPEEVVVSAEEHHQPFGLFEGVPGLVKAACGWAARLGYPEVCCQEMPVCAPLPASGPASEDLLAGLVRERLGSFSV
jgi:putative nucleotidyltransferase with HDIG domain